MWTAFICLIIGAVAKTAYARERSRRDRNHSPWPGWFVPRWISGPHGGLVSGGAVGEFYHVRAWGNSPVIPLPDVCRQEAGLNPNSM